MWSLIKKTTLILSLLGFCLSGGASASELNLAKKAKREIAKMGYFPVKAVTVSRSGAAGVVHVKLISGQALRMTCGPDGISNITDLNGPVNQRAALLAHARHYPAGYKIENDPFGMYPAMTRRGNVRRYVVGYEGDGFQAEVLGIIGPNGKIKRMTLPKFNPSN